jgi:hypothetical protein
MLITNAAASEFSAISIGGNYSDAAIRVYPSACQKTTFIGVIAGNGMYPGTLGAKTWDIQGNATGDLQFLTTFPDLNGTGSSSTVSSVLPAVSVSGLSQLDNLNGNKRSVNLRGKDLAVGAAATTLNVSFPITRDPGNGLASATPAAGGSLTAATYYYTSTFVNALGESSFGPALNATVDGATTQSVTLGFYGTGAGAWRRRVYRGRAAGVYDGYYDLPIDSSANFNDTGAAFTGVKSPPIAGVALPSGAEPDANYSVVCTPQWNATCWVTAKATTGFTLNFSAAPGGGGSFVDWHLIR